MDYSGESTYVPPKNVWKCAPLICDAASSRRIRPLTVIMDVPLIHSSTSPIHRALSALPARAPDGGWTNRRLGQ